MLWLKPYIISIICEIYSDEPEPCPSLYWDRIDDQISNYNEGLGGEGGGVSGMK